MKRYYLAYGSNLDLQQLNSRCKARLIGKTTLENYQLVYKGSCDGSAYLTVEEKEGSYVPLGVFKISKSDEMLLDEYECYPEIYLKKYITINIHKKKYKALIYIMREEYEYHLPSDDYLKTCRQGYCDFEFEQRILDNALEETIRNLPKKLIK